MIAQYLLDTNIVSYIVKGQSPKARQKLRECAAVAAITISAITEAEIRYGLRKRAVPPATRAAIEQFLLQIDVVAWDSEAAKAYAEIRVALEAVGKTLGNMDLLIAAQAMARKAILVSNDRAFSYLKGLFKTVNWADDLPIRSAG